MLILSMAEETPVVALDDETRAAIREGLEQARRGEFVPLKSAPVGGGTARQFAIASLRRPSIDHATISTDRIIGAENVKRAIQKTIELIGEYPEGGRTAGQQGTRVLPAVGAARIRPSIGASRPERRGSCISVTGGAGLGGLSILHHHHSCPSSQPVPVKIRRRGRAPGVGLAGLPDLRALRLVAVPGTRLEIAERLVLHLVELGVELDHLVVVIAVVGRDVMARALAQRAPDDRDAPLPEQVAGILDVDEILELERHVMQLDVLALDEVHGVVVRVAAHEHEEIADPVRRTRKPSTFS